MNQIPTTVILVAGGKGVRMGTAVPKQFLPIQGKPVLYHALKAFTDVFPDINIVLVLPQEHFSYSNILLQALESRLEITIVAGGATRYHSVQNGLQEIHHDGIVFIHDGVRPFVSKGVIERCYEQAIKTGTAIPAIPVTDSIRQWDGHHFKAINRDNLRSIQTPQTFKVSLIKQAFTQEYQSSFTDETTVLENMGIEADLVEGAPSNIKITTPEDMIIAEAMMQQITMN